MALYAMMEMIRCINEKHHIFNYTVIFYLVN